MVRKYNPQTVINPRSGWEGDFFCDEGSHPVHGQIVPVPWEKNMCLGSGVSWGYLPGDTVMTLPEVITMLVNVLTRDGNLLLNVGPDPEGRFPQEMVTRLSELGEFTNKYGESIFGTRAGPLQPVDGVFGTVYQDNKIYLHILDPQAFAGIDLEIPGYIEAADVLTGGSVTVEEAGDKQTIKLGKLKPAVDTIVRLEMREAVKPLVFDKYELHRSK
jgi:alpha-L-fucosidase